tara:strand:- start:13 stop:348 length:336 start_codon:yes stop_codon:yes gene_type:complete
MNKMTIKITPTAIENIKVLQAEYGAANDGLRFGIKKEGCSGYKYILEFEESPEPDDVILKFEGIDLYINTTHLKKLNGSTIGWKDSLIESGFDINNPHAKQPCGCGESVNF